jgi:hypothetical protein
MSGTCHAGLLFGRCPLKACFQHKFLGISEDTLGSFWRNFGVCSSCRAMLFCCPAGVLLRLCLKSATSVKMLAGAEVCTDFRRLADTFPFKACFQRKFLGI